MLVYAITAANRARFDAQLKALDSACLSGGMVGLWGLKLGVSDNSGGYDLAAGQVLLTALNDVGHVLGFALLSPPWAPEHHRPSVRDSAKSTLIAAPPSGPTVWEAVRFDISLQALQDEDLAHQVQSRMTAALLEFALRRGITHILGASCKAARETLELYGLDIEVLSAPFDTAYGPAVFGYWRVELMQLKLLRELCDLQGPVLLEPPPALDANTPSLPLELFDALADEDDELVRAYLLKLVVMGPIRKRAKRRPPSVSYSKSAEPESEDQTAIKTPRSP